MLTRLRSALRRGAALAGRDLAAPGVFALARRPSGAEAPISVHMLVSSRTWHAGVLAAVSFEFFTGRRWQFIIHDDGSVDERARGQIERLLPGVRFVARAEAERRAAEFLSAHPKCLANRSRHNLFLKFFDAVAFAPHERFIVLDSDVLFFDRPQEILDWADSGRGECWFNEDTKETYCISRDQIEAALGIPLWSRVNSGLCLMHKPAVSLDLSERLLASFEGNAWHPQFFEQTLFALNASAFNQGGMLPRKYDINWGYLRCKGSVCRHYVGAFKHDLLYIEGAPTLLMKMAWPALRARLN